MRPVFRLVRRARPHAHRHSAVRRGGLGEGAARQARRAGRKAAARGRAHAVRLAHHRPGDADEPGGGRASGIGATYADRLARRGYDLYLVARDQQRLDALATSLHQQTGRAVRTLRADLTNRADLLSVAERLRIDGAITMLVNNAGTIAPGTLLDGDFDALEAMIQLNVVATSRLAVEAARAFLARGHGTIVNIASVLALTPERERWLQRQQGFRAESDTGPAGRGGGNGRARAGANE
jgi:hypothetical protein